MVGRIILPQAKNSTSSSREVRDPHNPPPPYSSSNSPEPPSLSQPIFSETMTTTVTTTHTTHTTTHFFSLPIWRRRGGHPMSGALSEDPSNSRQHLNVGENGAFIRTSFYNIDKDLPAVPAVEHAEQPLDASQDNYSRLRREAVSQSGTDVQSSNDGSLIHGHSLDTTPSTSQNPSTFALARAALGLGLPHVMPQATASASISDATVKEQLSGLRPKTSMLFSADMRRSKSITRARSEYFPDVSVVEDRLRTPRRNTVVALEDRKTEAGYEGKGKDRATVQDSQEEEQRPKLISRRPSFWNRRRVQSLKAPQIPTSHDALHSPAPALPTLQPVSPMFADNEVHSSPAQSPSSPSFHPSGRLRRRHSERGTSFSSSLKSPLDSSSLLDQGLLDPSLLPVPPPIPKRSPHRPISPEVSRPSQDSSRLMSQLSSPGSTWTADVSSADSYSASRPHSPPMQVGRRPRSMTNPSNILHRLSMGFFSPSSQPSPLSSPTVSTNVFDDKFASSSPRTSASLMRSSISKSTIEIPKPREDEEPPDVFLARLEEAVNRAEIVNVLAGSGDPFYIRTLQLYMDRFDFTNDPLDISLRKMLMGVGLPKETQQIDRVMEAFASRYLSCNPGLFVSNDHPYILAFSLIMLHTDAFNKSNKRKMSKADYIKNTKLVGVPADVLDYFYDNIVFAPFIFIEDPVDINGQRGLMKDGTGSPAKIAPSLSSQGQSSFSVLGKSNRIDPYFLITRNLLSPLRIDVESHVPYRNPYSYQGTAGSWNEGELRRSFALADVIEVDSAETRRMSTVPFLSLTAGGTPGPMLQNLSLPYMPEPEWGLSELSTLKVTKVGLLNRKDDLLDGGKRAGNRKWKECSVILTGSQLLFFRDASLALELIPQLRSSISQVLSSQLSLLNPEELLSVNDTIAVYDSSYLKHRNVLRLVLPTGRQILLQAESEQQRNEWIAHVNYASAFKTAGIRMRSIYTPEDQSPERRRRTEKARYSEDQTESRNVDKNNDKDLSLEASSHAPNPLSMGEATGSQSRPRIIRSKIKELEERIESTRSQLDAEMRIVRNLAILTPFQRATRSRLQIAVIGLGKSIKYLRLDIVKTTCHRDVLSADLASEQRERRRHRKDEEKDLRTNSTEKMVPRMTLSVHEDDGPPESSLGSLSHSDLTDLSLGRPESSICESFHSALDFNPDWQISTSLSSGSVSRAAQRTRSSTVAALPATSGMDRDPSREVDQTNSISKHNGFDIEDKLRSHPIAVSPDNKERLGQVTDGQVEDEVEAEEWHKTRAAKRVSLVKVPRGLLISTRQDGRHADAQTPPVIPESDSTTS